MMAGAVEAALRREPGATQGLRSVWVWAIGFSEFQDVLTASALFPARFSLHVFLVA